MPAARSRPPSADLTLWSIAVLAGFALVDLGFPTWDYYFDGLVFAGAVESAGGGAGATRLFHPHHLLYCPAAWTGYQVLLWAGLKIRAWLLLQWLSSVCGIVTLWLFRRLARRLGAVPPLADAGMAALGASYIFWNFSTQGDTTLPLTLALLALLAAAVAEAERKGGATTPGAGRLGAWIGGAALLHESAVIVVPAVLWLLGRTGHRPALGRRLAACLGACGVVIVAGYATACRWGLGLTHPGEMVAWARGYFGAEPLTGYAPQYGRWAISNPAASLKAFGEAFVGPAADGSLARPLAAGLLAGIGAVLAIRALARAPHPAPRRAVLEGLGLWLCSHALFFTWWMPGHTRFWTLALPGWVLLMILGLDASVRTVTSRRRAVQGAWALAALLMLIVGLGPFRREIKPEANRWLPITDRIVRATPPDSLIVISGIGNYNSLKVYLPYFAVRYMLVLDWRFADPGVPPDAAVDRLARYLRDLSRQRPVYALSEVLGPELDGPFERNHGVTPAMRRRVFAAFHPRPVAELEPGLQLLQLR